MNIQPMLDLDTIHHGDCLGLMRHIPDGSVDMILCDLPYGTTRNRWDAIIPFDKVWEQYERVIKANGAIVLTASQPFTSALVMSNPKMFRHEWIWLKNRGSNYLNAKREPMKEHESVLVFAKGAYCYNRQLEERSEAGKARTAYGFNSEKKQSDNYGQQPALTSYVDEEKRVPRSYQRFNTDTCGLHPTIKPVALFEYLIKTYTNPGEVVLDNCAGSCTTAIAALNTGRRFICIEQEEKYVAVGRQRIIEYHAKYPLLAMM